MTSDVAGARVKGRMLLVALAVLVLDQWTKWLIERHVPPGASMEVVPGLNLGHVQNTGVAFGLFAARGHQPTTWLLTGLGLAALAIVLTYFWRAPSGERTLLAALALILGGAVGNLLDRLATGAVTDFIDVYVGSWHWHTFNVADSAITIGILLMVLDVLRPRPVRLEESGKEAVPPGAARE